MTETDTLGAELDELGDKGCVERVAEGADG